MLLARGTMRVLRREAAAAGLSMPQAMILSWLAREGPRPTTGWSERIGTSPSATSELVDGLEGAGAVRRRRNPTDRRQVMIELTADGHRLFEKVRAGQREHLRRALSGLPRAELELTLRTLERLTERLAVEEYQSGGPAPSAPVPLIVRRSHAAARPRSERA